MTQGMKCVLPENTPLSFYPNIVVTNYMQVI